MAPIERFTRETFEQALPIHKDTGEPLWKPLGLVDGEYTYRIPVNGSCVAIEVRSSVDNTGIAAESGSDSIRCWLTNTQTGKPLGSKVSRWTTRLPGWESRLTGVLRTLWQWRVRAGDCPHCQQPKGIYKVKKEGKNKGRPFAKCFTCGDGFVWLDVAGNPVGNSVASPTIGANKDSDQKTIPTRDEKKDDLLVPMVEEVGAAPPNSDGTGGSIVTSDGTGGSNSNLSVPASSTLSVVPSFLAVGKQAVDVPDDEEVIEKQLEPIVHRLNEQQRQAVEAPVDAAVRVLAPPGAGKTLVISYRYAYLLENGAKPRDILAVTFSRSMADELLEQIKRVSPQIADTDAEKQVCTIHAICYRMLKDSGDNRSVPKEWQIKKVLNEIAESLWPYAEERPGWKEIYYWINNAKYHGVVTADDLGFFTRQIGDYQGRNLHEARRRFDEQMKGQRLLTFPDMLFNVEQKLKREPTFRVKWQTRFKWVMVDECQDTNSQAMRILTTLAQPQNQVFMVGDSDQLLFRFTGATPEANLYDGFEKRYPDGLTVKLVTNYRSTQAIIETCQRLIACNYENGGGPYGQQYFKDVQPRDDAPIGNPVSFREYEDVLDEADGLVEALVEQLAGGRQPGDFFVGARTRAQLGYLEGPLVRAKIPFINITGGSFWTSKHVADVVAYLRLAYDEGDDAAFKRVYNIASNWNVHLWGEQKGEYCHHRYLGRAFLDACGGSYKRVHQAVNKRHSFKPGVNDLTKLVYSLKSELQASKLPGRVLRVVIDDCYRKYLAAEEGVMVSDEAENGKLEDLETVIEIASQFDGVGEFLEYVDEAIKAAEAAKDKSWGDYVVLSSVHRLKGLERPVVYGIGISEGLSVSEPKGLLPHTFSLTEPPQDGILPTGGRGRVEDERCVCFVLASRAKEECHLSGVQVYRNAVMRASRFVGEMGLLSVVKEHSDD